MDWVLLTARSPQKATSLRGLKALVLLAALVLWFLLSGLADLLIHGA